MVERAGLLKRFLDEDDGLTSIEYALILMLLLVLCISFVRVVGSGTSVTAEDVSNRTTHSSGAVTHDPARGPDPVELTHSSPPSTFDGILFVALACLVTACLFTGICIVCYRIGEWKAKLATLRSFRKRTDGEKIEARLRNLSDAGRRVLDTRADGPILDRYVAAISPPPVTVSNVWWLGPNTNTILERHVGASADVERPSLPPHPDLAPAPTPGRVIVFDAASMEAVATHGAALSDTPTPCPPDTSPTPPSDH